MTKEAIEELRVECKRLYELAAQMERVADYWEAEMAVEATPAVINGYGYNKKANKAPRPGTIASKIYRYIAKNPGAGPKSVGKALKLKNGTVHATLYKGKRTGQLLHHGKNSWKVNGAAAASAPLQ